METKQNNTTTALVESRQSARTQVADAAAEHPFEVREILVPTDFSPTSLHALDYAVPLARQLGGQITLLHVMDWPVLPHTIENFVIGDRMKRAAQECLDALAQEKVPPPLLAKTLVRTGSSSLEITRLAQGLKSHLIILSADGRTGFKRAMLGSTAECVVRHAPCPVLSLPPPRESVLRARLPVIQQWFADLSRRLATNRYVFFGFLLVAASLFVGGITRAPEELWRAAASLGIAAVIIGLVHAWLDARADRQSWHTRSRAGKNEP